MARALLFLLAAAGAVAIAAEDPPRLEILRAAPLSSFGPFSLAEGRDGAFLLLEAGPAGPAIRVLRLTPSGHKRRLRSIEPGSVFTGNAPTIVPDANGGWLSPSDFGILAIDARGTPALAAASPGILGPLSPDLVAAADGSVFGLSAGVGGRNRFLYRWSAGEGFTNVHEFTPATDSALISDGPARVDSLIASRDGGCFALRNDHFRAPGDFSGRSRPAIRRAAVRASGEVEEGPLTLGWSGTGLGELPDGRLATLAFDFEHRAYHFAAFDAAGAFSSVRAFTAAEADAGVGFLGTFPGSGTTLFMLDRSRAGSAPIRLMAITPAGEASIVPLTTARGSLISLQPLTLAHDGNFYGYGVRMKSGGQVDAFCFFRIIDPGALVKNLPPIARDDEVLIPAASAAGGAVTVMLPPLKNDTDADGDPLAIESAECAAPATVAITPDGRQIELSFPAGAALSSSVRYRIADGRGGVAGARIAVRLPERGGRFIGVAASSGEAGPLFPGLLDVQVSRLGQLTGRFYIFGDRYDLRGRFDESGRLTLAVPIAGFPGSELRLERGAVAVAAELTLGIYRQAFTAALAHRPAPGQAGNFTALLHPGRAATAEGLPDGIGWALVHVAPSGYVSLAGKLGDGSSLSTGSRLDGAGRFPVYAGLARVSQPQTRGELYGTVALRRGAQSDGDGTLLWIQGIPADRESPGFFQGTAALRLSRYLAPDRSAPAIPGIGAAPGGARLTLGGRLYAVPWESAAMLSGDRIIAGGGAFGVVRRADGRVSLAIPNYAAGGFLTASGVVFQAAGRAAGVFVATRGIKFEAGYFTLDPR